MSARGRSPRYEWAHGGLVDKRNVDGPWVCDCPNYGLEPLLDRPRITPTVSECQRCYRPVYKEATRG